jgi:hypothetical protein
LHSYHPHEKNFVRAPCRVGRCIRAGADRPGNVLAHAADAVEDSEADRRAAAYRDEADHGRAAAVGLIPNDSPSIEEMRGYIASEHVKWGALVKQLGLEGSQ